MINIGDGNFLQTKNNILTINKDFSKEIEFNNLEQIGIN